MPLGERSAWALRRAKCEEEGKVALVLAKRRNGDLDHLEPVVEIFAKASLCDQLLEIPVRGRENSNVHLLGGVGPERLERSVLENPQELRLGGQRHFGDFVEQQCATVGGHESSGALGDRTGEGALSWPKSSASRRLSGKAAQLMETKGLLRRELDACSACASSSLPVPLSPVMRTDASVGASVSTISSIRRMGGEWPMIR
jgi:hypothetical protein